MDTNKFIYSLIIFIFSSLLLYSSHYNGKNFYDNRIKNKKTTAKVFDLGHKYLPDYSHSTMLIILMEFLVVGPLIYNYDLHKKLFNYLSPIMLFRYICSNLTILPKSKNCNDGSFGLINLFNGHCYDKIFSGHMSTVVILSLLLYDNKKASIPLLIIYNLIVMILILLTRSHYTVDIVLAIYISISSYLLGIKINL